VRRANAQHTKLAKLGQGLDPMENHPSWQALLKWRPLRAAMSMRLVGVKPL
jgi:hypothetical protein